MSRTCLVLLASVAIGCFRFTEDPARTIDGGADAQVVDTAVVDTAVVDTAAETAPTMCDRYGGFTVVQAAMASLVDKLKADCRVDRYFVTLPADRLLHMQECMSLQLGSIMRCSRGGVRVKYPGVDSKGVLCRDMKGSHATLGIHDEDFDALVDDALDVLTDAKVSADDLKTIGDVLRFEATDIVNPGDAGRGDACLSDEGAGGVDTGSGY